MSDAEDASAIDHSWAGFLGGRRVALLKQRRPWGALRARLSTTRHRTERVIDDLLVRGHISDAELVCLAIAQLVLDAPSCSGYAAYGCHASHSRDSPPTQSRHLPSGRLNRPRRQRR